MIIHFRNEFPIFMAGYNTSIRDISTTPPHTAYINRNVWKSPLSHNARSCPVCLDSGAIVSFIVCFLLHSLVCLPQSTGRTWLGCLNICKQAIYQWSNHFTIDAFSIRVVSDKIYPQHTHTMLTLSDFIVFQWVRQLGFRKSEERLCNWIRMICDKINNKKKKEWKQRLVISISTVCNRSLFGSIDDLHFTRSKLLLSVNIYHIWEIQSVRVQFRNSLRFGIGIDFGSFVVLWAMEIK